jgi:hypothetical protein
MLVQREGLVHDLPLQHHLAHAAPHVSWYVHHLAVFPGGYYCYNISAKVTMWISFGRLQKQKISVRHIKHHLSLASLLLRFVYDQIAML